MVLRDNWSKRIKIGKLKCYNKMPLLVSSGSITYNPQLPNKIVSNYSFCAPKNFINTKITWNNPNEVPAELFNQTLYQLLSPLSLYKTTLTFMVNISGTQSCSSQTSRLSFSLNDSNIVYYTDNIPINTIVLCNQAYPLGLSTIIIPENELQHNVSQEFFPFCVGILFNNDVSISQITYTIGINSYIDCPNINLNQNVCIDYCTENPSKCLFTYVNYCFQPGFDISKNSSCKGFIENYIQKIGPNSVLDSNLLNYCSKYTNFYDFQKKTENSSDREICACHLSDNLYTDYYNQLLDYFPAIATVSGLDKYCVYPPCASSPYKNLSTGKQCQVPNCINFVGFGPNGNFSRSDVKIGQSCTSESNVTLYVVLGTLFVIFLFLFILYLLR